MPHFVPDPLWNALLLAAWITVLNPISRDNAPRLAILSSAIFAGAGAYVLHASLTGILAASLFCVGMMYCTRMGGLLWWLALSVLGYRRKSRVEDPIECSGVQGELGGGGYRHTGISLRGQRAARSWS